MQHNKTTNIILSGEKSNESSKDQEFGKGVCSYHF